MNIEHPCKEISNIEHRITNFEVQKKRMSNVQRPMSDVEWGEKHGLANPKGRLRTTRSRATRKRGRDGDGDENCVDPGDVEPGDGVHEGERGCADCYAMRMARRLCAMGQKRYARGFEVVCHEEVAAEPLRWKKPRRVFVNSMSDLFHDEVPEAFLRQIFSVMNRCPQHQFQALTKRSERLAEMAGKLTWTKNIWMGVTVENQDNVYRIHDLVKVPAAVRFLSCKPLLGPLELSLAGIGWVIVGGESGPGRRAVKRSGSRGFGCSKRARVPFFFFLSSGRGRMCGVRGIFCRGGSIGNIRRLRKRMSNVRR